MKHEETDMKYLILITAVSLLGACSNVPYGCRSYDNCTTDGLYAPQHHGFSQEDSIRYLYKDDPQNSPQAVFDYYAKKNK
jgi:hypothetical protein